MEVLHKHETRSLFTNKITKVLCLGVEGNIYSVWVNYDDNQQTYNVGTSLREACAWFLRRGDEDIITINEALNWQESRAAKELEEIIFKKRL